MAMEKFIPHMPLKFYRVEVVGLSMANCALKNTIFVNMWNLGRFREKKNVLSITASNFECKIAFARVWHVSLSLSAGQHISFLPIRCLV